MKSITSHSKLFLLAACMWASAALFSEAKAAGYQDIAYSVARLSTTASFLYLPSANLDAYNSAFNSIVYYDAYAAYALLYLGNANYQADSYGFTGQHYNAYYRYLGVVNAVQRGSSAAFYSYYQPTANYYGEYYNDYAASLRSGLLSVSESYANAARIGSHVRYLDASNVNKESFYSGATSGSRPWEFDVTIPSSPANIASDSVPTALYELGHYYVTLYWQANSPSFDLIAANAAWNAASPYNSSAAYSYYLGLLGRYYAGRYIQTSNIYSFYYWYVAALYSGSTHSAYEQAAYLTALNYLNTAKSTFSPFGTYSEQYFNAAKITLY